jgi:hypothetical protein
MNDNIKQPDPEDAAGQESAADDPREALKHGLDKTRLSPDLKAQILAELPPPEEREQMYRESIANGGLSFEDLCASLGIEANPTP